MHHQSYFTPKFPTWLQSCYHSGWGLKQLGWHLLLRTYSWVMLHTRLSRIASTRNKRSIIVRSPTLTPWDLVTWQWFSTYFFFRQSYSRVLESWLNFMSSTTSFTLVVSVLTQTPSRIAITLENKQQSRTDDALHSTVAIKSQIFRLRVRAKS